LTRIPAIGPIWRALRVIEHVLTGTLLALVAGLSRQAGLSCRWVPSATQWWHRRMCNCLELKLQSTGTMQAGALLVANHISWLDIPVLGALGHMTFVSKDDVRHWPVVGWLAKASGTLFIKRGANQARTTIDQIVGRLERGGSIMIFPEGTTSDGRSMRRFHPRLFAAVQRTGPALQPVAIRYGSNARPDPVAPFVGNDSLILHLLRVLRHPGMGVEVAFLAPVNTSARDRRALADAARAAIAARLGLTDVPELRSDMPRDTEPRRRAATHRSAGDDETDASSSGVAPSHDR